MKKSIIVIGGGIVGVAAALQLQLDGHQVRLLDRQQPGRETSYGNAGVLSDSSAFPSTRGCILMTPARCENVLVRIGIIFH